MRQPACYLAVLVHLGRRGIVRTGAKMSVGVKLAEVAATLGRKD